MRLLLFSKQSPHAQPCDMLFSLILISVSFYPSTNPRHYHRPNRAHAWCVCVHLLTRVYIFIYIYIVYGGTRGINIIPIQRLYVIHTLLLLLLLFYLYAYDMVSGTRAKTLTVFRVIYTRGQMQSGKNGKKI